MESSTHKEDDVFEKLMDQAGMDGKFQFRFNLLFNMGVVTLLSMGYFNTLLALTVPGHWCLVPGRNETNFTLEEWKELTIPMNDVGDSFNKCSMYSRPNQVNETQADFNGTDRYITDCQHGWEYDTTWYKMTAPSQEDWVCNRELHVTNALFIGRAGEAVGSLVFGHLGDIIGRRPVTFISVVIMVVGRCTSALTSGTYYLFLAACFIGNSPANTMFMAPLIIGVEISSKEQRAHIAMLQCFGWTAGSSLIPLIAWVTGGEWKILLLVSSTPALALFFIQKIFPESPRWLASRGKYEQCEKVLRQISNVNGKVLTQDTLRLLKKMNHKKEAVYGIASLFSSWRLAKNTFLVCNCVVLCHLIYYTVIIMVTGMSGNPYLNFFLQASVELPAFVLGRIVCDRFGRRWSQAVPYITAAIALVVISYVVNVPSLQWLLTPLVVFIKFLVSITLYVAYLLNTEMFPTCVRQTASSTMFMASGILGVVTPYIAYLGTAYDARWPYYILAIFGIMGAVSSLLLPETLNQKLPDTLSDAAHFGLDQKFWSIPSRMPSEYSKCAKTETYDC